MNYKLLFFFIIFTLLFCFFTFSESGDILFDPKEIIIKPKAINGYILFMVKYNSGDFKLMVQNSIQNGTGDRRFKIRCIDEKSILFLLGQWEWMANQHGACEVSYYAESMIVTIKNIESGQEFKALIFPFMRRAFIPNITIGKYKFVKVTLTICLGNSNVFNNDIMIDSELPGFTINSNTAIIYGIIDFKGGVIKHSKEENRMKKLRKYIDLMRKFKKNENIKVIELNSESKSTDKLSINKGDQKGSN